MTSCHFPWEKGSAEKAAVRGDFLGAKPHRRSHNLAPLPGFLWVRLLLKFSRFRRLQPPLRCFGETSPIPAVDCTGFLSKALWATIPCFWQEISFQSAESASKGTEPPSRASWKLACHILLPHSEASVEKSADCLSLGSNRALPSGSVAWAGNHFVGELPNFCFGGPKPQFSVRVSTLPASSTRSGPTL